MPNKQNLDLSKLPKHIAIIMDGNGRWAAKRHLPRVFGHREGVKSVREAVESCAKLKIGALTLYAFSTENWVRPKNEVNALMLLLKSYLKKELNNLMKNNIRLATIGDISRLPESAVNELQSVLKKTSGNTGLILNLALNYGGRQEIVRAVNAALANGADKITEEEIEKHLDTAQLPELDLVIRTSGEMRLSNFLLWQCAYAEFYSTEVLWPDFREKNLIEAIIHFQKRERRYGGISAR